MSTTTALAIPQKNTVAAIADRAFSQIDPDFYMWLRLPGEPEIWHQRFSEYLALPLHERSILRVCNRNRMREGLPPVVMTPNAWLLMSSAWRWKDRATAYDEHQAKVEALAEEAERKRLKKRRLSILSKFHDKVDYAIDQFNPDEDVFRLSEITGAIAAIGKEYRAEFDDEPTQKVDVTVTSIADMLRQAEKEKGYAGHDIIDAEYK